LLIYSFYVVYQEVSMSSPAFAVLPYIVSSLVYFVIGALWYTPLFGKAWAKEVGRSMEGSMAGKWGEFAAGMLGQLVSSFLYVAGVYMILMLGKFEGLGGALTVGASVAAFFVLSINSGKLLFQGKPRLFFIDAGYGVVGAFAAALILAFWR
jgi:hypothetical protein